MKIREHGVILGTTQSGKTTQTLRLMRDIGEDGLKIFVNTKREQKWTPYFKHKIMTPEHMEDVYENYPEYLPFFLLIEPDVTDRGAADKIAEIFDVCLKFHQDFPMKFKTYVFIDEIHVFQSKFTRNESFARIFSMGMGLGLFGIAISQRASSIHNDILKNCGFLLLAHQDLGDLKYLRDNGIIPYDSLDKIEFKGKFDMYIRETMRAKLKRVRV